MDEQQYHSPSDEYGLMKSECVKKCLYPFSVQPCGVNRTHPECDLQDREQMCRLVEQKNVPAAQHALQSRTSSAPPLAYTVLHYVDQSMRQDKCQEHSA